MPRLGRAIGVVAAIWVVSTSANVHAQESVADSPHNLSTARVAGAGTDEVCVFCHTPHAARPASELEAPLWNRPGPNTAAFTLYDSSTIDGTILTVGSVSAACLTCHDGTQARDTVINAPGTDGIDTAGSSISGGTVNQAFAAGFFANLGTDLTNDHPIGAPYGGGFTTAPATADPDFVTASSGTINGATRYWVDTEATANNTREKTDMILFNRADGGSDAYVECGTCHDPHNGSSEDTGSNDAGSEISFMRISNSGSAVCLACHIK